MNEAEKIIDAYRKAWANLDEAIAARRDVEALLNSAIDAVTAAITEKNEGSLIP